jgi:hypothetical protein
VEPAATDHVLKPSIIEITSTLAEDTERARSKRSNKSIILQETPDREEAKRYEGGKWNVSQVHREPRSETFSEALGPSSLNVDVLPT